MYSSTSRKNGRRVTRKPVRIVTVASTTVVTKVPAPGAPQPRPCRVPEGAVQAGVSPREPFFRVATLISPRSSSRVVAHDAPTIWPSARLALPLGGVMAVQILNRSPAPLPNAKNVTCIVPVAATPAGAPFFPGPCERPSTTQARQRSGGGQRTPATFSLRPKTLAITSRHGTKKPSAAMPIKTNMSTTSKNYARTPPPPGRSRRPRGTLRY